MTPQASPDRAQVGKVIESDPAGRRPGRRGQQRSTSWSAAAPDTITVPNVVGLDEDQARDQPRARRASPERQHPARSTPSRRRARSSPSPRTRAAGGPGRTDHPGDLDGDDRAPRRRRPDRGGGPRRADEAGFSDVQISTSEALGAAGRRRHDPRAPSSGTASRGRAAPVGAGETADRPASVAGPPSAPPAAPTPTSRPTPTARSPTPTGARTRRPTADHAADRRGAPHRPDRRPTKASSRSGRRPSSSRAWAVRPRRREPAGGGGGRLDDGRVGRQAAGRRARSPASGARPR